MISQNKSHTFIKHDIKIIDSFIEKFAKKYIEQRSITLANLSELNDNQLYKEIGFDSGFLENVIRKHSVAKNFERDNSKKPNVLNDIYRSDLGELLMTYYFEEKLDSASRFIIPMKNITYRERADQPGRGLDAIGYRKDGNSVEVLIGEAKVSSEQKNPPSVVDKTADSIFSTQKKHNDNMKTVVSRLTDYCKRLDSKDAFIIGLAIFYIDKKDTKKCSITFGCTLIRDHACVDEKNDFGKLKTEANLFGENTVHFSILSFTPKTIDETVQLFYNKVQELIK